MEWIDRYAYNNRLRHLPPAHKGGLSLLTLALCLLLNRPAVGLAATMWMWLLATIWAGIPPKPFSGVLAVQAGFLLLGVLGVVVQVGAGDTTPLWQIGSFAVTEASLTTAFQLFGRALGCTAAMSFLAFTTPLTDLIDLGRRGGIPSWLLDLATLIYRFTFVLLQSMEQMVTAQQTRLGYVDWRRSMHSAAQVAANLLLISYRRTKLLQLALEGRGYRGELTVLPHTYQPDGRIWVVGVLLAASLLLLGLI
jgi:cobalt/nickel transport system permease protein